LAVIDNDIDAVKRELLTNKQPIIDRRETVAGHSPLSLAIELSRTAMVECLLELGANANASVLLACNVESTPLIHLAARCADDAIIGALLAAGADVSVVGFQMRSACHEAAHNSNEKVLARLIAARAPIDRPDLFGMTPCRIAAENSNAAVIEMLIAAGCDVNRKSRFECTACHRAAENANDAVMAQLIAAKADVNVIDSSGVTPIILAAANRNARVIELLIAAGANPRRGCASRGRTLCHVAAANPNEAILKRVLALGVDVNARDRCNWSACHFAAETGTAASIEALVAAGAAIDVLADMDQSVLHLAARNVHADALRCLLRLRSNVDVRDIECRTPCCVAVKYRRFENVRALLEAGADINAVDDRGASLLHAATECVYDSHDGTETDTRIVQLLLQRGADFRLLDNEGRSPLHTARAGAIALLFARGADINTRDKRGFSPANVAGGRNVDAFATMIAAGADISGDLDTPHSALFVCDRTVIAALLVVGDQETAIYAHSSVPEAKLEVARSLVARWQWVLFAKRALEICIGLQSNELPALVTCEILAHALSPCELLVAFHRVWTIATKVKHFRDERAVLY
jgi:ankyrin repeat protein